MLGKCLDASKMLLSRHQNSGQNRDLKIANILFEYVAKTVTNQSLIHEAVKRLNSGNACYNSIQNHCLLVCCLKT
jgi:hypothetical protein